ncbi:MAG: cation transporter [Clostridia bacterium]|nr:cation transporter [Clostridia bacterium]MBQ2434418.1 cation transporter [Clostridia bacterium]MBQ5770302.1 cation transporter [Clostridia bacterium]
MKKTLLLNGLCCAHCAAKIEKAVGKLDGVISTNLNFMTTKLSIEADQDKMESILTEAEKIIKKVERDIEIKRI